MIIVIPCHLEVNQLVMSLFLMTQALHLIALWTYQGVHLLGESFGGRHLVVGQGHRKHRLSLCVDLQGEHLDLKWMPFMDFFRIGKSSMILANQAKWRCELILFLLHLTSNRSLIAAHGLWGQAKFQNVDSAPFAALVGTTVSLRTSVLWLPSS